MKKLMIFILLLVSLTACEQKFQFEQALSLTSERVHLEATEGSTPVIIYANGAWTARLMENVSWARIENTSGRGLSQLKFFYDANEGIARKVTIEIKADGEVKYVDMVQKSGSGDIVFSFPYKSVSTARNGVHAELPFTTNLPETEFDGIMASALTEDGKDIDWISDVTLSGNIVKFELSPNDTGAERIAVLALSYTDAIGTESVSTLKLTQTDETPWFAFDESVIGKKHSSLASTVTLPYTTNMALFMKSLESQGDTGAAWAKLHFPEDGSAILLVDMEENADFDPRSCELVLPFTDSQGNTVTFNHTLTQKGKPQRLSLDEVKAKVDSDEFVCEENVAVEAVVISDCEDPNMESAPNLSVTQMDSDMNARTAYVQSPDGTSGFRIVFATPQDNTLHRGDKVFIDLDGLKIIREHDPERYTISDVTGSSVSVMEEKAEPVIREKTLSELTDSDVYTLVRIKGLEMSFKNGAYTNCHDGYSLPVPELNPAGEKTNVSGYAGSPQKYDSTPCSMIDAEGNDIYLLINNAVTWRRYGNGVPQGLCNVTGILVHSYQPRWARKGYLGRYQLRPSAESDIAPAGEGFSKVIVSWHKGWDDKEKKGPDAKLAGMYPQGVDASITSNMDGVSGVEVLTAVNYNDLTNYNKSPAVSGYYKGQVKNGALTWKKTGGYFWASDDIKDMNAAPWFCMDFSTKGLSGNNLTFIWSAAQGTTRSAADDLQAPTQYKVEYSTDGVNFTAIDHIYAMHPIVPYTDKVAGVFAVPGLHQYVTQLPASLLGQERVYVRVRAASAVSLDDDYLSSEGGTVKKYSNSIYTMIRFGEWTIQYN